MGDTDDGIRCAEHLTEVFPPRCERCDAMRSESPAAFADPALWGTARLAG